LVCIIPAGDVIRCSTYDTCDTMEWAEAFAGAIPGPQKLAIVAKRVAKVTITVKDALRREQELKRALKSIRRLGGQRLTSSSRPVGRLTLYLMEQPARFLW
jgi:hypothetical protein